jgi:glycosyltransferase involved in cell wall biosynthesis
MAVERECAGLASGPGGFATLISGLAMHFTNRVARPLAYLSRKAPDAGHLQSPGREARTKAPILIFEMTWTGTIHAPGNSSTIEIVARAFPDHPVHVFAEAGHVRELRRSPLLDTNGQIVFHDILVSRHFQGSTGVVSWRRLAREFATLWTAVRRVKQDGFCLLMLLSATPTAVFAASWLARLRGRTFVQVGLHGNLNDLFGRRSRNPLARALDLVSAMTAKHGGVLRFLVLEDGIRTALARSHPVAAARTDVVPLPVNLSEFVESECLWPPKPLRIGFVGQATEAKGIGTFLEIARVLRARHGPAVAFHLVGRAMPGADLSRFTMLEEAPQTEHLPRAEFIRRISGLHYVILPFRPGYYDLAASGALIDAVTWLKPVIATAAGFIGDFFKAGGDIGHLCQTETELLATVETLVASPDRARYTAQVNALRAMRDKRSPAALAETYKMIVSRHFPRMVS